MESTGVTATDLLTTQQATGRNLAQMQPEDFFKLLVALPALIQLGNRSMVLGMCPPPKVIGCEG